MMKDPAFAQAYADLEPEYEAQRLIIEARIKEGLSQKELAKRTGLTSSSLSRIEHGKSSPTIAMLQRLARGMGKTLKIEFV
jgi:transcriptional regulator with XRE-family HTH domain